VTYDKIKKGRSIDSIQFHISKKAQPQELNGEYKEREQDPAYLQGKKNREEQRHYYQLKQCKILTLWN
jgi:plasmid replication initiation protein